MSPTENNQAARQKILIVDDKKANLFTLANLLKNVDAEVVQAMDGQSALAQVLEHDFALIILDVRMPGMDGYEVARHLQGDNQTRKIPIIFVTAEYPDEEHMFRGYEVGAIDYMLKPYSPRILLGKVAILLEINRDKKELQQHRDHLEQIVEKRTKELAESNAILQAAMDNCQAGIAIADAPDGKLRYVNEAGLMMRGASEKELVKNIEIDAYVQSWQILHAEDGTPYRNEDVPLARALLTGEPCSEEYIIRRNDHDDRRVWANAAPIKNEAEEIIAGIVVFLDITDRKEKEEELKNRNRELQKFNKASIGRELRMVELKKEINTLCKELGRTELYRVAGQIQNSGS